MFGLRNLFNKKETPVGFFERNRTAEEREATAYHEAGHAILAILKPSFTELDYVTIKCDEENLGNVAMKIPEKLVSTSKTVLENAIMQDLAGYAAEEIVFGYVEEETYSGDYDRAITMADQLIENGFTDISSRDQILEIMLLETKKFLLDHRPILDNVAQDLLLYETLPSQNIQNIINSGLQNSEQYLSADRD